MIIKKTFQKIFNVRVNQLIYYWYRIFGTKNKEFVKLPVCGVA